tara:strand:- start:184 stop:771 length:588 start_codon:yes stop_codon:yes gene_type:complete
MASAVEVDIFGPARSEAYTSNVTCCRQAATGTQIVREDGGKVFLYVNADDAGTKVYLSNENDGSDLITATGNFAEGRFLFISVQNLGGDFGNITQAGFYTISKDASTGNAAYITTLASTDQMTLPTDCDFAFFPGRESPPTGKRIGSDFTDNNLEQLVTQYKRGPGTEDFVPLRMKVRGPSNLRSRATVYKVEKG